MVLVVHPLSVRLSFFHSGALSIWKLPMPGKFPTVVHWFDYVRGAVCAECLALHLSSSSTLPYVYYFKDTNLAFD